MGRNRVLSFMSQFSSGTRTPSPSTSPPNEPVDAPFKPTAATEPFPDHQPNLVHRTPISAPPPDHAAPLNGSPPPSHRERQRSNSRLLSIVQAYHPPLMDINEDTIPELQPIFSFLNSHSNKLYQEGYFLKLDDQNTQGKPNPDRTWTECFAQLVGTVLSLWDAAELDAAGEDGEVLPKFINLTDASIKMIESLPTHSSDERPLQNILSISTAGRNRYLLHFNSHHSLIQWTAGIRLAMFEQSTLQEAYTGALIAGKGKALNNINVIMERSRFKTEEWVRVRFGAGVPWRRCWCVISPPDEKEYAKLQKELRKRSPYDRSPVPILKGDVKFYDTRKDGKKQKKMLPIATITDVYSAYAIYPQAKSLMDASTLLKIEGSVTVHANPPTSTEGFIFIMPETHPAVSGFEMLLRFLFPTWDTFGLYGRPGRLVASVLDPRSLMFAMPKHKRYGYLEILDVSSLILEDGSAAWTEKDWRRKLKEATGKKMNTLEDGGKVHSRSASRSSSRLSFGGANGPRAAKPRVGFADEGTSVRSSRSFSLNGGLRTASTPLKPSDRGPLAMPGSQAAHARNSSDPNLGSNHYPRNHYGPPQHATSGPNQTGQLPVRGVPLNHKSTSDFASSDDERGASPTPEVRDLEGMRDMRTPEPVSRPPAFNHASQARPMSKAYHSPELRRANSRLSSTTLAQLAKAGGIPSAEMPSRRADEDALSRSGRDKVPAHWAPSPHDPAGPRARPPRGASPMGSYPGDQPSMPQPQMPNGRPSPFGTGPPPRPSDAQQARQWPGQSQLQPGGVGGDGAHPHQAGAWPPAQRSRSPNHVQDQNVDVAPGASFNAGTDLPPHRTRPDTSGNPSRKPLAAGTHQSIMPDDIIAHYASDSNNRGAPIPPQHQVPFLPGQQPGPTLPQGRDARFRDGPAASTPPYQTDRRRPPDGPRAGVLRTVGGGEPPMQSPSRMNIPDVDFGPTINYGASPLPARKGPVPSDHPSPHLPPGDARRHFPPPHGAQGTERAPPRPPRGPPRQDFADRNNNRTVAWQPGLTHAGPGAPGLSPEMYVQQRAGGTSPQYMQDGHFVGGGGGGGGGGVTGARTPSPQAAYFAGGRGGGGVGGGGGGGRGGHHRHGPAGMPFGPASGSAANPGRAAHPGPPPPFHQQYGPRSPAAAPNSRDLAPQHEGRAF